VTAVTFDRPRNPRHVAVLDVGKTNVKVVLHDLATASDAVVLTRPNAVVTDGLYPHFDVDALFAFMIESLREIAARHPVDAVSVTTHGASITLVGDEGLAMPVLDYEYAGPDAVLEEYERVRSPFPEAFTPRLPGGMIPGVQMLWQQKTFPDAFRRVRHIVTYPQYWGYRLTGNLACEATSLGCHADLWAPREGRPSSFAVGQGWAPLYAPVLSAFDVLGTLTPAVAAATGLRRETPVLCGIHDSNASLLPHLMSRSAPFSVVSTGTWTISFAVGGSLDGLDAARDTLANVDAFARAVPSARTMGGREFDILTGGRPQAPTAAEIATVIDRRIMALPGFVPGNGPYPRARGRWTVDPETLSAGERTAAAGLYSALMTAECLALVAADGPTVVEGPFARNRLILAALAEATGRPVEASTNATGTSAGAALLALGPDAVVTVRGLEPGPAGPVPGFAAYAADWRAALPPP
jgi:sugar (pentulose or hexulose) kinase